MITKNLNCVGMTASYLDEIEKELNALYVDYTGVKDAWVCLDSFTIDRDGVIEGLDNIDIDYVFNVRAGESNDHNDYKGHYRLSPYVCRTAYEIALFILAQMEAGLGQVRL